LFVSIALQLQSFYLSYALDQNLKYFSTYDSTIMFRSQLLIVNIPVTFRGDGACGERIFCKQEWEHDITASALSVGAGQPSPRHSEETLPMPYHYLRSRVSA
jgi:hypothetical protein